MHVWSLQLLVNFACKTVYLRSRSNVFFCKDTEKKIKLQLPSLE